MMLLLLEHQPQARNNMKSLIIVAALLITPMAFGQGFAITDRYQPEIVTPNLSKPVGTTDQKREVYRQQHQSKMDELKSRIDRRDLEVRNEFAITEVFKGCSCTGDQGTIEPCDVNCQCGERCKCTNCTCHNKAKTVEEKPLPPVKVAVAAPVRRTGTITADMHSHKCAKCGTEWWHSSGSPNASHNCPNCGSGPYYVQYRTRPPANLVTPQVYSGGCANGACLNKSSGGTTVKSSGNGGGGILGRIFGN